jgi:predicted nucleic acid-binding protein
VAQVIDASVAIAWCAPSQANALTRAALMAVVEDGASAPAPFLFEVIYGLARLERRRLISQADAREFLIDLSDLALALDHEIELQHMIDLRRLAANYELNIFDASYLELALRTGLPLATRDKALARAATAAGVPLFRA